MNENNNLTPRKMLRDSLPIIAAIFLAAASVAYILFKNWSNKLYYERWKDYDECGEGH